MIIPWNKPLLSIIEEPNYMLIVISGTPGTGKTTIAKLVAKKLGATLIDTDYLLKEYKIGTGMDEKRHSKIIDTKKLAEAAVKEAQKHPVTVFEGHLSHFAAADLTIILRTEPGQLSLRLKEKGWGSEKIKENLEAEVIDEITSECFRKKNVIELDTTDEFPEIIATLIVRAIKEDRIRERYSPGHIDWSDKYVDYINNKKNAIRKK
jgi:adenylate kinase